MHAADDEWDLNLFVLVSRSDPASGQSTLDKLVGGDDTESIRRIVFAHHELGLEGVDAEVYSMKGYGGKFDWYGAAHVGAILKVRVRTSK